MANEEVRLRDFWTAMGEEFSHAVSPPVAFEDASPQECCEPLREVLGQAATPWTLAALDDAGLQRLAVAFGAYFDVPPAPLALLRSAVAGTLARWPATEWPQGPEVEAARS